MDWKKRQVSGVIFIKILSEQRTRMKEASWLSFLLTFTAFGTAAQGSPIVTVRSHATTSLHRTKNSLDTAARSNQTRLAYRNPSNSVVIAPYKPILGPTRIADDITTTALNGCELDRFIFRVSGDAAADPKIDLGPYTIEYAFYPLCPSTDPSLAPIQGISGTVDFVDDGIYDVEIQIPDSTSIQLPTSFYFALTFFREGAGVYFGEPTEIGYSDDLIDHPGLACRANFGGYPIYPHASFQLEIHVRQPCTKVFLGYKNSSQAGNFLGVEQDVIVADDLKLEVPDCQMVAYEVWVGAELRFPYLFTINVQLHTGLSDSNPLTDNLIEGTVMIGDVNDVPLFRATFDPPISIPEFLWVVMHARYSNSSDSVGPVVRCNLPSIGHTEDTYSLYDGQQWQLVSYNSLCHTGFDAIITCAANEPAPNGDINLDGHVDLMDVALLQSCFANFFGITDVSCIPADFNSDELINLTDYAKFYTLMTGP